MREWVPATDLFIQRWEKELVPHNLCAAIHDIWESLELPSIQCPVMLLLTENESVEEPSVVDHLGRVGVVYDLNTNSWKCGSAG